MSDIKRAKRLSQALVHLVTACEFDTLTALSCNKVVHIHGIVFQSIVDVPDISLL